MSEGYTTVSSASDVTEEIMEVARGVVDGWYGEGRIDWEDVWDRMDGTLLEDGTTLDMGNEDDTPAMRKIKKAINQERR